jgi:hypothetical protein
MALIPRHFFQFCLDHLDRGSLSHGIHSKASVYAPRVTTDFFPACFSVFLSIADHAVVLNSFRQTRFMLQWLQADFTVHLRYIAEVESCKCRAINGSSPVARQAHNLKVVSSNLAPATNLRPSISSMKPGVFWWLSLLIHTHSDLTKNRPVLFCATFF